MEITIRESDLKLIVDELTANSKKGMMLIRAMAGNEDDLRFLRERGVMILEHKESGIMAIVLDVHEFEKWRIESE